MKYFSFREYAVGDLTKRGQYKISKEVMNFSFQKENQFKEHWVGMYMFKTAAPTEDSPAFGNFNLEIDDENFLTLRLKMLTIIDYLFQTYGIKAEHLNFQLTNRSLWLSIPSKVFGCYGKAYLYKIHKKMAEEIEQHLRSSGFQKGIDMAIYRWNGLMRSLGSYLPKAKRWVTKFSVSDLEDSFSFEQLAASKFDNGVTFADYNELPAAKAWFQKAEKAMWRSFKKGQTKEVKATRTHTGMETFIENGELPFNRNLHIYSTALYLKGKGLSEEQALETIQTSFQDNYLKTKEALRTIQSAFKGDKYFSPMAAQGYLDEEIFKGNDSYTEEKTTFIVPRVFFEILHKEKAHYQAYKLLFQVLYTYQIHKKSYNYNLKGEKYKKDVLGYFEILKNVGFIQYVQEGDQVIATIANQPREIYKSHIVVPSTFMERKVFKKMKREFILLVELWKSGYKVSETKSHYYVNMKFITLQKRLSMTAKTLHRYFSLLKRAMLYFNQTVQPMASKKEYKKVMKKKVDSIAKIRAAFSYSLKTRIKRAAPIANEICEKPLIALDFLFSDLIIKCNYSP